MCGGNCKSFCKFEVPNRFLQQKTQQFDIISTNRSLAQLDLGKEFMHTFIINVGPCEL